MKSSKADQQYDEQWDVVDTFYNTNEPEGFGSAVTTDEAEALQTYYFVDTKRHNVHEYRMRLTTQNPDLAEKAKRAARKIAQADGLSEQQIEEMFQ